MRMHLQEKSMFWFHKFNFFCWNEGLLKHGVQESEWFYIGDL